MTGLGVSAHRDALPVIRMQPDVQNQGYVAGYAAATSAASGVALRDLDVRALQQHLVEIGNLPERVLTDCDSFPLPAAALERAVHDAWDDPDGLALMFADPERSLPLLRAAHDAAEHDVSLESQRVRYAHVLGLLGDDHGRAALSQAIQQAAWDEGWNYRGMGQFGMSTSPLDGLLIALGDVGDASDWPVISAKLNTLPDDPAFSHCRAISGLAKSSMHAIRSMETPRQKTHGDSQRIGSRPAASWHVRPCAGGPQQRSSGRYRRPV